MKFLETTKATVKDPGLDGFRMRMIFSYRKYSTHLMWNEIDKNPDMREVYTEEMIRFNQANLARRLKILTGARGLLDEGPCGTTDDGSDQKGSTPTWERLQLELKRRQMRKSHLARWLHFVTGLLGKDQSEKAPSSMKRQLGSGWHRNRKVNNIIFETMVGGQCTSTSIGSLKANVSGFRYKTNYHGHFKIDISYDNIKHGFCLVEDKWMRPLLHFSLHDHIMVGTTRIKHIQFRWSAETFGEAPLHLVNRVELIWGCNPIQIFPFEKLEMKFKFHGKLPGNDGLLSIFYLTFYSLVLMGEAPSIVAKLNEIEIVNLAECISGEIQMTVILQDFNILRINSIPLEFLGVIKQKLNAANVKFYVNKDHSDWECIVQGVIESPKDFIENGGWDRFGLETDAITLDYYSDSSHREEDGED